MRTLSRAAILATIALALAACSTGGSGTDADSLTINDTWVKSAESGMTAAFGVVTNDSDHDITIVGASSDAATMVELHEVVDAVMQQVEGGLTVPAGGELTLQPGGFHLMFMGIPAPLMAGDEVSVTLELEDGSTLPFTAVVKDFTGADEEYAGDMDMDHESMDDMDMSASPSPSAMEGMDD